ncbi:hypothetical protein LEP1GSC016_1255 [Leptospira borgpetersenii serovar Hardjo-bovis str. Sponselee]|uniref:Uncharacterized protein n=1 Tax=Leptospira borgpetersenii serovar Hardjo-bovis str. Sponselee TaxID=1303729 RepID=M6BSG7_LEPBO|nr:hypothetical protein LEP1GSC121_3384 [Leptospira borgpetersenii serovar Castellonis str. 200801910]EMJ79333.1 hypothetical protein LEP1GSC016_1255 [Leptospira borgpetersenii serovar Hardjo-bovis str. Sponselee]EMO07849.1 hypothetical protein LEP1GSC137_1773 [Leptospira borgpetersenii str. Noumea 25]
MKNTFFPFLPKPLPQFAYNLNYVLSNKNYPILIYKKFLGSYRDFLTKESL